MATNITKENLIRLLQDDPVLLEELRSLLLTRELLELPEKFAEFAAATGERLHALEQSQTNLEQTLANFMESTERYFAKNDNDIGYLKGVSLEAQLPGRARAQVEHYLGIRRTRVLRAVTLHNLSHDFEDAVYEAEEAGVLTRRQRRRILNTDMVVRGRSMANGGDVYVAVEASFTADDSDIDRASRSAEALRKVFPNADAAAAVYCESISTESSQTAEDESVKVIANETL